MAIPLEITFRNMDRSQAVVDRVNEKMEWLAKFYERIEHCRVVIEAPHRNHSKGNHYKVHLTVGVPGQDIVAGAHVGKSPAHEDVYVAVRDAFNAARRELKSHNQKQRGEVKSHGDDTLPAEVQGD
ncbi:MAG: HPF/RaiA family ribosome-associated protein [Alphaproteobacteria bacterium]